MDQLTVLHALFEGEEADLEAFGQYLQIKAEYNIDPNKSVESVDEKIVNRLLRDFLRDSVGPIFGPHEISDFGLTIKSSQQSQGRNIFK